MKALRSIFRNKKGQRLTTIIYQYCNSSDFNILFRKNWLNKCLKLYRTNRGHATTIQTRISESMSERVYLCTMDPTSSSLYDLSWNASKVIKIQSSVRFQTLHPWCFIHFHRGIPCLLRVTPNQFESWYRDTYLRSALSMDPKYLVLSTERAWRVPFY